LISRIRQMRVLTGVTAESPKGPSSGPAQLQALETRVAHLEQLVEGLQDSVHREFERHDKLLAELDARLHPAAIGAALDEDARNRGL
jgi:hypothetical protein